jgi:hypothetical protein
VLDGGTGIAASSAAVGTTACLAEPATTRFMGTSRTKPCWHYLDGGADDDDLLGGGKDDTLIGGIGADVMFGDAPPGPPWPRCTRATTSCMGRRARLNIPINQSVIRIYN